MRGAETPPARIETDRLILRPPRPEDAPAIAARIADYDIGRMLSGPPWPYTLADAHAFVARCQRADPAHERPLAIEHRAEGVIGMTGFSRAPGERLSDLGYWLAKPAWGQGYATEATQAALAWASRAWGKRALRSGHFVDNPASARVLAKAGFLYTGDVRPQPCAARDAPAPCRQLVWLA